MNSAGSSEQKFAIYQESTAARLDKLKASWEGFWQSSIDSSTLKGVINTLTFLINSLGNLPTVLGIATTGLLLWKGSLLLTRNAQNAFVGIFPSLFANIRTFSASLDGLTTRQAMVTVATRTFTSALNGLKLAFMSNPIGLIITGLTTAYIAFELISQGISQHSQKQKDEFNSLTQSVQKLSSEISDSEKLIKTYNDLSQATSLTSEQKQKLADVTEKLSALYPNSIDQFDAEGKAISLNSGKLQEYLDLKEQELNLKRQEMSEQFYKTGDKDVNNLLTNEKNIKSKMDQLADYERIKKEFLDSGMAETNKSGYKTVLEDINRTKKELLELKSESIKTFDELKSGFTATLQNEDGFKDFKPQELDNFISSLLKSKDVLEQIKKSGGIEIFSANLIDNGFASTFNNINKEFNDLSKNTNKTQKDIDDFNNNAVSKLTEKLSYLGNPVAENVAKAITDKFGLSISEAKEKVFDFNGAIESIQKTTTDTSEKIELYNQLLEKAKESNNDAAQEVMKHVDKHKDLYDVVDVENGMLVLNTSKLNDLKNKTIETATVTNKAEIEKAKIVSTQTTARLAQYNLEITKLTTLLEIQEAYLKISNSLNKDYISGKLSTDDYYSKLDQVKKDVTDVYVASRLDSLKNMEDAQKLFEEWKKERGYSRDIKDSKEMSAMRDKINGYVELKQAVEKSNAVLNSPNLGIKDSNSTTNAKSAESLAWEKVTNEIKKYNNALTSLEDITSNAVKGSQERRDALHAENLKIKEQIDYLKQQRDGLNTVSITSFTTSNGKLPNPIPGTQLKDSFGAPRDGGSRKHEGIDIMADFGTEIHSTTSGKVLSAGNTGAKGGWGVTISDPQGNRHYYAHMNTDPSKILGIGQEILAGQVIGYVGDSGNAKGTPHLHYGITDANKKAINPYNLLTNDVNTALQKTVTTNTSRSAIDRYKISPEIVNTVLSLAQKYNVDPALILAIGEQETNWGKSGDGKNGMYTGYGSYDSGSDYTKAGLEQQVEGTVKKMLAWGMTPGNVSFDKLNQGNKGNLPTGIYATDDNWQNSVWNLYKEFSNGQMTSTISSELSYEKLTEDRIKHQEEINAKILELEKKFAQNSKEWYTDLWQESDNIISEFEQRSNFSKVFAESMSKSSPEYRNELLVQKNNTTGIQKQLAEQAKQMDQAIENMKKGIIDGTFKDKQFLEETIEKRKALSAEWWNKQKEISDKQAEITSSEIEEVTNKIDKYNEAIKIAQSQQEMNEKGTEEYNNALKNEIIQYSNIKSALLEKQAIYQKELADTIVGTLRYQELQKAISDTTIEILDNQKALYDNKKQIIDDTISLIKDAYEKEKDIALEAIDEQMEAEDKRHDKVKENLDDELDQYEDSINQKLKLLDELSSTEDYEDNIKKLNEEKLDIQKQIDYLGNDDSYEAKAKKEELLKELSEIDLEISKTQKDREKELLKDSLNDQLDAYEKDIKEKQDAEDDKYDAEKERLEKIKDETEKYYQDMIDNEINFSNISQELMKGNIDNTISELTRLLTFVKNNISNLGQGVGNTLASEINNSINQLTGNLGSSGSSTSSSNNNSNNNSSNNSSNSGNTPSPIATFSPGSYENTDGTAIMKSVTLANALGESVSWDGEGTPVIIGGKSFAYKKIEGNDSLVGIREVAEALGHDVEWNNGIIDIYHEGGIIANKPTNKIMDIVNKLFNTQSNETVVKMLKGELAIPQNNVMKNFIPNMQNFVNSFIPNITPSVATSGGNIYNLTVEVANMNANSKSDIDNVTKYLINGVRKFGKQI